MKETETPLKLVRLWASRIPGCYDTMAEMESNPPEHWEAPCVLPIVAAQAVLHEHGGMSNEEASMTAAELTACYLWRKNKIIYRFDSDLSEALSAQTLEDSDKLPVDLLMHLPTDCCYIKSDAIDNADGFFTWIEYDTNRHEFELRIQLMESQMDSTMPAVLHLTQSTVGGCIADTVEETMKQSQFYRFQHPDIMLPSKLVEAASRMQSKIVLKVIQHILYLVAENRDQQEDAEQARITRRRKPNQPIRDKFREIELQNIGIRIGSALRAAKSNPHSSGTDAAETQGSKKRSHLRRGHWHTYWVGPRSGERKTILKWVAPTIINPSNEPLDNIVVYPVK